MVFHAPIELIGLDFIWGGLQASHESEKGSVDVKIRADKLV